MRHAFIMDPLDGVNPCKDTTYFLMLAATQRGHEVYFLSQNSVSLRHTTLVSSAHRVTTQDDLESPFIIEPKEIINLNDMDCVWERTDPPFNRRYFYTSLLLDFLPDSVTVVNRPQAIRDWNEKLAALKFSDYTPQTLVSAQPEEIEAFVQEHGRITLKPIDGHGGKGVEFSNASDVDRLATYQRVTASGRRWTIAQAYLEAASDGDKRILLLQGEPIGAILRVHAEGQELNNLDAGGTAKPTKLTDRDLQICRAVGPALKENGIVFAGIDVIGDYMIEVNVTSPTGIQEASRFSGQDLHHIVMQSLEHVR